MPATRGAGRRAPARAPVDPGSGHQAAVDLRGAQRPLLHGRQRGLGHRLAERGGAARIEPRGQPGRPRPGHPARAAGEQRRQAGSSAARRRLSTVPARRPGQVQLNPQALETIHADSDDPGAKTARSLGFTGAGVTVGFIADGLDTNNPDFIRRQRPDVFVDYKDFSGEGTGAPTGGEEAFGDASSIAAQGREVYNISDYSALPLNRPCNIRIEGVAPGREPRRARRLRHRDAGFNSSIPAGDRLRGHDRPRQRAQRVARQQLLPRRHGQPRPDQAGQRRGGRGRDDRRRLERRRRRDEHDRNAGDRPERDLGRRHHHLPDRPPGRVRRRAASRASRAGSTTTSARSARAASSRTAARSTSSRRASSTGRCARRTPRCTSDCINSRRQSHAGAGIRRHQRVRAADRRRRGAGDPGVPPGSRWRQPRRRRSSSRSSSAPPTTSAPRPTSRAPV